LLRHAERNPCHRAGIPSAAPADENHGVNDGTAVNVIQADIDAKPVVGRLLELYLHDFSVFTRADVDDEGRFGYDYLDAYWTDSDRKPFLFRVDGRWCGFALVRTGDPHDMAEFFVMRKYRRSGVGITAARDLFARFPGRWQVRQLRANTDATTFWRRAIPVEYREEEIDAGPVQRFEVL
jgi:predicted acetyltransferase